MQSLEASSARPSPYAQVQPPRPLAPSQELAYRDKCIALKRRLMEIEQNNDNTRKRLEREKRFQDKMRLNRAILLNHLKEMIDSTDEKPSDEEISEGLRRRGFEYKTAQKDYVEDESSDEYEDEDMLDPVEPSQLERGNSIGAPRDTVMYAGGTPMNATNNYNQSTLPSLAPAQSHSSTAPQEAAMLTSSFRVSSGGQAATPISTPYASQQQQSGTTPLAQLQSPPGVQQLGTPTPGFASSSEPSVAVPVRPPVPFDQFAAHMTPQLAPEFSSAELITQKIRDLWTSLKPDDRQSWDDYYEKLMIDYEHDMDEWKRGQRKINNGNFAAVNR